MIVIQKIVMVVHNSSYTCKSDLERFSTNYILVIGRMSIADLGECCQMANSVEDTYFAVSERD